MKEGWEVKKLGEVCEILMGQSPSSDTYNDSADGIPFFQGNADFGRIYPNIRMYCNAPIRIANEGDILISVRAPIGAINISNVKCCIGRGLASIKSKNVNQEFIYHALIANREKLISQGTGSTFKSISKSVLYDLPIPLPPLPEQEKIVAELDCLSGIIEKKKQQLKELDALAQSIFYEMFGDPVENEKGWEVKSIKEVAPSKEYKGEVPDIDGKYWLLNLDMVVSNTGEILEKRYYELPEIGNSTIKFNADNILYSKLRPYLNKVVIPEGIGYATSELIPLYPNNSFLNKVFLASLLRSAVFVLYISSKVAGAKMPRVSMGDFWTFPIILPPLFLQHSFASKVEAIEKQKELIKQSIAETELLFNSRMQYYFG